MRILLATDGSQPAGRALNLVANMAWPTGTSIRLVSAVPKGSEMVVKWTPETASLSELDRIEDTVVRTHAVALDSAERDLRLAHPECTVEGFLLRGRPASRIVDEARDFEADLIVVGHRGHGPMETMLLGSVSAEVVDHAPCPVLVARSGTLGPVVLADDGSPSAVTAAAVLEAFPLPAQTPITVLSITDTGFPFAAAAAPGLYDQAINSYVRSLKEARDDTTRIATGAADRLQEAGYRTTPVVRDGARDRAARPRDARAHRSQAAAPRERGAKRPAPCTVLGPGRACDRCAPAGDAGARTGAGRDKRSVRRQLIAPGTSRMG